MKGSTALPPLAASLLAPAAAAADPPDERRGRGHAWTAAFRLLGEQLSRLLAGLVNGRASVGAGANDAGGEALL